MFDTAAGGGHDGRPALARYGRRNAASPVAWLLLAAGATAYAVMTLGLCTGGRPVHRLRTAGAGAARPGRRHQTRAGGRGRRADRADALLAPAIGSLAASGSALPFAVDLQVYSWSPLNALRREFVTADGLLSYAWPNGLWYALAPAHRFYFTPLLAPLLIPGLWAVIRRRAAGPLLLLAGWAGVIFVFHAGGAVAELPLQPGASAAAGDHGRSRR
ncbi:MAG: hypothetical protein R2844_08215 [Caldilineales bacterium]